MRPLEYPTRSTPGESGWEASVAGPNSDPADCERLSDAERVAISHWHYLVGEMLVDAPEALEWLTQAQDLAFVWDHIVDGDATSPDYLTDCLEAVLLEWPANAFYLNHRAALVPALAVIIDAWRCGDGIPEERIKAFNACSDLALTVAFLVGGRARVQAYGPAIRSAARKIMAENDRRREHAQQLDPFDEFKVAGPPK